jgi:hypothetical protein
MNAILTYLAIVAVAILLVACNNEEVDNTIEETRPVIIFPDIDIAEGDTIHIDIAEGDTIHYDGIETTEGDTIHYYGLETTEGDTIHFLGIETTEGDTIHFLGIETTVRHNSLR